MVATVAAVKRRDPADTLDLSLVHDQFDGELKVFVVVGDAARFSGSGSCKSPVD